MTPSPWPAGGWDRGRADGDADVLIFGDSITSGQSASRYDGLTYAQRLRASLRTSYGDGGSGFTAHNAGSPADPVPGGSVWTVGGTTGAANTTTVPNGHVVTLTAGAPGPRLTLTADGTDVALYLRRAPGDGTARWRVDDGPWQPVVCTGTAGYVRAAVEGLGAGTHFVDLEATVGTIGVAGIEGRNPTGCRLHIMGLGGRTSAGNSFAGLATEDNAAFRDATLARWTPHLLVVNLGVNDVTRTAGTVPAAAYKANMAKTIGAARAVVSDCDVVLVANFLGKFADNNDYDSYIAALLELADEHGAVVVDLDTWARTVDPDEALLHRTTPVDDSAWARWSRWGWLAGGEAIHPNDVGHAALGYVLAKVLTAAPGTPVDPHFELGGLHP